MDLTRSRTLIDRKYMEYFIPTIANTMATSLSFIVDGIIVSVLLGENAMAAVNACLPVSQIISMAAALFGLGASGRISVAFGRRERDAANRAFTALLALLLCGGILLTAAQLAFFAPITRLLLKNETLAPLISEYYRTLAWGTPFMLLMPAIAHLMRAEGQAKLASSVILIGNAANLILDVVFIRVFQMGIGGASLATVCSNILGVLLIGRYFFTPRRTVRIQPQGLVKEIPEVLRTGLPAAFGTGLVAVKINIINNLTSNLEGSAGVVAFSICMSCLMFMSMFISGASQSMMPLLGVYYGERDYDGARMVVRRAVTVLAFCAAAALALLEAAPELLLRLYRIEDPAVSAVVVRAVRIFSLSLPGTALSFLLLYFYMTTGKRNLSTLISVVNGLVAIVPCAWLFSRLWGLTGIWAAFPVTEVITLVMVFCLERGRLFALPSVESTVLLSLSADQTQIQAACTQLHDKLLGQGLDSSAALFLEVAAEEIMENSAEHSGGGSVQYDLLLRRGEGELMLSVADNGKAFDPLVYSESDGDRYRMDHIRMLQAISTKVEYQRVIGLNKTCAYIAGRGKTVQAGAP